MKHTPKSIRLYKKWVIGDKFDPYNPSDELENELYEWKLPASNYVAKEWRGIPISRLDSATAGYIAFVAIMGSPEIRLLAKIRYYILDARDVDTTKQDIYDSMIGRDIKEHMIIAEVSAKYLKDKWSVE